MKVKNSNCDETQITNGDTTQKLKLWQNSKTQTVAKLKNSNCDKTQIVRRKILKNSKCHKTQIVTKFENSNLIQKTQKLKLWQKLKTQIVSKIQIFTKLKLWWNLKNQIVMKLKNSNVDKTQKLKWRQNSNSECDKTQKLKLWQNWNFDKTHIVTWLQLWPSSYWPAHRMGIYCNPLINGLIQHTFKVIPHHDVSI